MSLCPSCRDDANRWIDSFQRPLGRWVQYQSTVPLAVARSLEIRTALVNDRAALIRFQLDLIRRTCAEKRHQEAAA